MYLLDTDTLSGLIKRTPPTSLVSRLAQVPPEQQFTSSITVGELVYGARRLGDQGINLASRIERLLLANLTVLSFDVDTARRYGETRALLESRGRPMGQADLMIASIALTHGLTLVTGNIRHFRQVPSLDVENWLQAS